VEYDTKGRVGGSVYIGAIASRDPANTQDAKNKVSHVGTALPNAD
jgi:hypothetical protein